MLLRGSCGTSVHFRAEILTSNPRLSDHYGFEKPNDIRALNLMNTAAAQVMTTVADLVVAYGVSDEFSFVFHKSTNLFERRASKLVSTIVSTFTAIYGHLWPQFFPDISLVTSLLPTFDGRAVCYPTLGNLRDYLSWRQVDCEWHLFPRYVVETITSSQATSTTSTTPRSGRWSNLARCQIPTPRIC